MIHCQSCCRKTKHHNREETCHVLSGYAQCTCACPEVSKVIHTCNVEPEYRVQCMVKADRNQQTVEETVNTCTYCAKTKNCLTKCYQCGVNYRPYKE